MSSSCSSSNSSPILIAVLFLLSNAIPTSSFVAQSAFQPSNILLCKDVITQSTGCGSLCAAPSSSSSSSPSSGSNSISQSPDIQRQLQRAKELLETSKAKLEKGNTVVTTEADVEGKKIPFFASRTSSIDKKIKHRDEKTGLVTADGERMAELSTKEKWEFRRLLDVFENEMKDDEGVYSQASQQLAERDVAASIWNLRKQLKQEDYMRIFDKRNFFIGEDN